MNVSDVDDEADFHLGNFSLPEFCRDAASLAKYLIRAREKSEPGFLGGAKVYDSWKLSRPIAEPFQADQLLRLAIMQVDKIWKHMLDMGGSGGVPVGDPLLEFKLSVSSFADDGRLNESLAALQNSAQLDWSSIAQWDQLSEIRAGLDAHYKVDDQRKNQDAPPIPPIPPVAESRNVKLFRRDDEPVAFVNGQVINKLNRPRYDVVRALLEVGEKGLSETMFQKMSRHSDAVNILKRLAKVDPWGTVIQLPGESHGGYRIS